MQWLQMLMVVKILVMYQVPLQLKSPIIGLVVQVTGLISQTIGLNHQEELLSIHKFQHLEIMYFLIPIHLQRLDKPLRLMRQILLVAI